MAKGRGSGGKVRGGAALKKCEKTGRFVSTRLVEVSEVALLDGLAQESGSGFGLRKGPKPSECTRYLQGRIAAGLPEIVDELLKRSKKGDAAVLRALWTMGKLDEQGVAVKTKGSSLAKDLLRKYGGEKSR